VKIGRLRDSKDFVGMIEKLMFNTFSYVKPVDRSEHFDISMSKRVLNLW